MVTKMGGSRGEARPGPARPLGSSEGPRGARSRAAALPHAPVRLLLPAPPLLPAAAGTGTLQHPRGPAREDPRQGQPRAALPRAHPAPLSSRGTHPHPSPPLLPRGFGPAAAAAGSRCFPSPACGAGLHKRSPRGHVLRAETGGDPRGKPPRTAHGRQQRQQRQQREEEENAPEPFHFPGNASRVGCTVPRAGLAQRRLANEPGGRDRLASSAEHKAKSAAGAAEGWRSLSPGWHWVPPESAGTTGTGSVPLPRCPCHQGDRCQRHRDPRVAPPLPGPWQWPSPAAHLPLPWAGGLRAPPPERSRTRSCSARCAVPRGRFLPTVTCGWRSRPAPAGSAARPCLPAPLGWARLRSAGLG